MRKSIGAVLGSLALLLSLHGNASTLTLEQRNKLSQALKQPSKSVDAVDIDTWLTITTPLVGRFVSDSKPQEQILSSVARCSMQHNIPADLVLSVIEVESHFNRYAISHAGALGLMQVMPFWIKEIGEPTDNLLKIDTNIKYGCTILKYYLDRHNGRWSDALAAYNGSYGRTVYSEKVLNVWQRRWKATRVNF